MEIQSFRPPEKRNLKKIPKILFKTKWSFIQKSKINDKTQLLEFSILSNVNNESLLLRISFF